MDDGLWAVVFGGALAAGCVYLAARVPSVWSGAQTPLWTAYGRSRRTYLLFTATMNAWFDGVFLLFAGMRFEVDPIWQAGTVLMVLGTPVALVLWIVVAIFNRPRFLVPPDQRERRKD